MRRTFFLGVALIGVMLSLSGCSLPGRSSQGTGPSVLKSTDGGKTYAPKVTIDAKTTIAPANIVSFAFEAGNTKRITVGTRENGIFTSENGGDTWRKLDFPPTKTYGLVSDRARPERLYATGEWEGRGKLYKSDDRGVKWEELYAEPNSGTTLSALAQSPKNPSMLFIGTTAGVVNRTTDGGRTWASLESAESAILSFVFDSAGDTFYILVLGKGIERSQDGGATFETLPGKSKNAVTKSLPAVTSIAVDPSRSGTLYAGTENGLFRSGDFGDSWEEIPVIESSKKFPVRALAVNPRNSSEFIYSAALALYKSVDGGTNWSIHELDGNRAAGMLRYDPSDSNVIYAGFRTF